MTPFFLLILAASPAFPEAGPNDYAADVRWLKPGPMSPGSMFFVTREGLKEKGAALRTCFQPGEVALVSVVMGHDKKVIVQVRQGDPPPATARCLEHWVRGLDFSKARVHDGVTLSAGFGAFGVAPMPPGGGYSLELAPLDGEVADAVRAEWQEHERTELRFCRPENGWAVITISGGKAQLDGALANDPCLKTIAAQTSFPADAKGALRFEIGPPGQSKGSGGRPFPASPLPASGPAPGSMGFSSNPDSKLMALVQERKKAIEACVGSEAAGVHALLFRGHDGLQIDLTGTPPAAHPCLRKLFKSIKLAGVDPHEFVVVSGRTPAPEPASSGISMGPASGETADFFELSEEVQGHDPLLKRCKPTARFTLELTLSPKGRVTQAAGTTDACLLAVARGLVFKQTGGKVKLTLKLD